MAKVFNGKVVIPGDKINKYLNALEEAEKAREPFRKYLEGYKEIANLSGKNITTPFGSTDEYIDFQKNNYLIDI